MPVFTGMAVENEVAQAWLPTVKELAALPNGRRLLPSALALWNEHRLLERLLYKSRNQHRATCVFRALSTVCRLLRRLAAVERGLHASYIKPDVDMRPGVLVRGGTELCVRVGQVCRRAYDLMQQDIRDVFFVPFSVTAMAMASRILVLAAVVASDLRLLEHEAWVSK